MQTVFMKDKLGKKFRGIISGVTERDIRRDGKEFL